MVNYRQTWRTKKRTHYFIEKKEEVGRGQLKSKSPLEESESSESGWLLIGWTVAAQRENLLSSSCSKVSFFLPKFVR